MVSALCSGVALGCVRDGVASCYVRCRGVTVWCRVMCGVVALGCVRDGVASCYVRCRGVRLCT